jgi:SAM-dependent methyltransferase
MPDAAHWYDRRKARMDTKRQSYLWDDRQVKRAEDDSYRANRVRLERIVAAIERASGSRPRGSIRVLNIGVGDARLERMLLDRGYDVHALDPSQSIVDWLREKYGLDDSKARTGWSTDLPFGEETFDWVVMSEVIEHIAPDEMRSTLLEVGRVLKRGGCLVGTVPDNEDLESNRFTCSHCGAKSHRVGHEQSFTVSSLRAALAPPFKVVRAESFRGLYMNWRGIVYYHWIDLPFKFARVVKPNVRAPHQIVFNIFFIAEKT